MKQFRRADPDPLPEGDRQVSCSIFKNEPNNQKQPEHAMACYLSSFIEFFKDDEGLTAVKHAAVFVLMIVALIAAIAIIRNAALNVATSSS